MDYKTVKRNSTPELVMKQILESIESGKLKPGDQLPTEQQLIEMFGVGRSTIREATSTLSMLGSLQSIQGKGLFCIAGINSVGPCFLHPVDHLIKRIVMTQSAPRLVPENIILVCHRGFV